MAGLPPFVPVVADPPKVVRNHVLADSTDPDGRPTADRNGGGFRRRSVVDVAGDLPEPRVAELELPGSVGGSKSSRSSSATGAEPALRSVRIIWRWPSGGVTGKRWDS